MYPKVKVRQEEEEEDDEAEFERIFVKLHDHHLSNSPAPAPEEHLKHFTPPHVRVSKSHTSSTSPMPMPMPDSKISAKKVAHQNKPISKKTSVSVLPPRAVLSSPENDVMHGIKTKTQRSGFKSHDLSQNTHVKCNKSYEAEKTRRSSWKS